MADHCLHEQDWGRVSELVASHEKEIRGNGKPGLTHQVTELSGKIDGLTTSVNALSTNVSALMRFENEFKGAEKATKYNYSKYIQLAAVLVTLLLGYITWNKRMSKLESQVGWINTPVKNERGQIVLYPSGMLVDSLSKESDKRFSP